MRLNKYISESGVCSRRQADAWIAEGRVRVNGAPAELGTRVEPGDEVTVDGAPVGARPGHDLAAKPGDLGGMHLRINPQGNRRRPPHAP